MDISQLVPALVTHLAPCLPALWQMGEKFSDGAAKKLGEKAAEGTIQLWQKLRGHAEARPALQSALTDLAHTPQDPDLQAALRVQLRHLLAADPALAKELATLLAQTDHPTILQNIKGDGNIVSAGDQHLGNVTQNFQ